MVRIIAILGRLLQQLTDTQDGTSLEFEISLRETYLLFGILHNNLQEVHQFGQPN